MICPECNKKMTLLAKDDYAGLNKDADHVVKGDTGMFFCCYGCKLPKHKRIYAMAGPPANGKSPIAFIVLGTTFPGEAKNTKIYYTVAVQHKDREHPQTAGYDDILKAVNVYERACGTYNMVQLDDNFDEIKAAEEQPEIWEPVNAAGNK